MPKTKKSKVVKTTKVSVKPAKVTVRKDSFLSQIKWGESYTSLFLGAVVVVVALVLVFSFLKSHNALNHGQTQSTSTVAKQQEVVKAMPKTYTVQSGDYLWSIAEKIYGSGYNWVDLAQANNLENPGVLYAGTKLIVPDVAPKMTTVQANPTQVQNPITGNTYTVVKGDFLWNIAVRAYGDGYEWVKIANANNLVNPDLVFSGNVLVLPR